MIFDWYNIFNLDIFLDTNLVSRTLSVELADRGRKDILISKANLVSVTIDGVMLALDLNSMNPFIFEGKAIYKDSEDNIWIGYQVAS